MPRDVVLWIDHRKAVIAAVTGDAEQVTSIPSGLEKHVRYSASEGSAEDSVERRFQGHLHQYYDKVVGSLRDARSILIVGPGEAKHELEKRLRDAGLGKAVVGVEAADKMTDPQIAARARQRFGEAAGRPSDRQSPEG